MLFSCFLIGMNPNEVKVMQMLDGENKKEMRLIIDRQTQIAIMNFFLKTSIPRILKNKENYQESLTVFGFVWVSI